MEEILRVVQRLHLSLLATCGALLVLSQSPDRARVYRDAHRELVEIRKIRFEDVDGSPERWERWSYHGTDLGRLHAAVALAMKFPDFDMEVPRVSAPEREMDVISGAAKLSALKEFFDRDLPLRVLRIDKDSAEAAIARAFPDDGTRCGGCEITDLHFQYDRATRTTGIRLRVQAPGQGIWTVVDTLLPVPAVEALPIELEYEPTTTSLLPEALIEKRATYAIVFPKLGLIWKDVQDLSIDKALAYVEGQVAEHSRTVELLGVEIDETVVTVGGPLLVFLLLLYFYVYLRFLVALPVEPGDRRTFGRGPWLAQLPGSLAGTLIVSELLAIPLVVGYTVVARMDAGRSSGSELAGLALVGGSLLLSGTSLGLIRQLRRRFHGDAPALRRHPPIRRTRMRKRFKYTAGIGEPAD